MEFKEFSDRLRAHVAGVLKDETNLFVVDVDKDALWNTYLDAFPPGTNEVYRKRREHDCSCCRHFLRDFGAVVAIRDNRIVTMWDFDLDDPKYGPVVAALAALVRSRPIAEVFVTDARTFGSGVTRTWTRPAGCWSGITSGWTCRRRSRFTRGWRCPRCGGACATCATCSSAP